MQGKFADEEPEIQRIIIDALLQNMDAEESENWLNYLENHISLPLHAKSRGLLNGMRKGTKVQIIKPTGVHPIVGIIVYCLKGKKQEEEEHPLLDFTIAKKADKKLEMILDAYSAWGCKKAGH